MFDKLEVPKEMIPSDKRFGVGPSLIPKKHLVNLAQASEGLLGTSHRQKAVRNVCKEMQDGIKQYFSLPAGYEVIMGNGGATFLFDMIGLGLVKKKSAHFVTGEFSNKWFKSHSLVPFIEVEKIQVPFGKGLDATDIADADFICTTLNETSTGVQISKLPDVSEDTILAVDATSGAGQIKVDFNKIDLYFFSPQKVFAGEGGFFIAIMSPKAMSRAEELYNRDTYRPEVMSWEHAISNSLKNQTYNTPSISSIFLLNEQVKLMNTLGEDSVVAMAKEKAEFMYSWAESKSYLSCYVDDKLYRSQAVATINVDDRVKVQDLTNKLRELEIVWDIEAYRKLGLNQFRISMFHNVTLDNLKKLTQIIDYAIEQEGVI